MSGLSRQRSVTHGARRRWNLFKVLDDIYRRYPDADVDRLRELLFVSTGPPRAELHSEWIAMERLLDFIDLHSFKCNNIIWVIT